MATYDDYTAQVAALKKRNDVAQALAQQASSTPWDTQVVNGVAVQHSPWEAVAQLGKGWIAGRAQQKVNQEEKDLRTQRRSDIAAASSALEQATPENKRAALDAYADLTVGPEARGRAMIAQEYAKQNEKPPNSVQEYEYARKNGFGGSFQDWVAAGGQSSRPSSVQEWEFYNNLPAPMQPRYLEMKRNPNFVVKDVNQVPTVVHPTASGTTTTPLSTQATEQAAAEARKVVEARGAQVGEAEGKITGGIETKAANAVPTQSALDLADPLIDAATGSLGGAAVDKLAAAFGKATTGAEASAQLKVLQAGLMTNMPRMEGPQSDRDVALYREAAGQIGDSTVPAPIKKAAVKVIRQIQQRYIDRAAQPKTAATTPQPVQAGPVTLPVAAPVTVPGKTLTYDPATGQFK